MKIVILKAIIFQEFESETLNTMRLGWQLEDKINMKKYSPMGEIDLGFKEKQKENMEVSMEIATNKAP